MLANSQQLLAKHLQHVAKVSVEIIEKLDLKQSDSFPLEKIKKIAYYAALFHDLGKTDPVFQEFILDKTTSETDPNGVHIQKKGFSFETHPRHNEISWLLLDELTGKKLKGLNRAQTEIVKNIVLWHHAAPFRMQEFSSQSISNSLKLRSQEHEKNFKELISELGVSDLFDDYSDIFSAPNVNITSYKSRYNNASPEPKDLESVRADILFESITSLIKAVVIMADRYVSKLGNNFSTGKVIEHLLEKDIYSPLVAKITLMEETFFPKSERSKEQSKTSKSLSKISDVAILDAPAGSGKTKTALQWAKDSSATKLFFIAPRTIICQELYAEIKNTYLPKGVSIELVTGEKKIKWSGNKEEDIELDSPLFKSNIVIMTIDQLCKLITSNNNIDVLFDLFSSHVVFDEFHEYYKMSGFNLLFSELITLKKQFSRAKTLLMSATPNYFFLEKLLEVYHPYSSKKNVQSIQSPNKQGFELKLTEYNENSALSDVNLFKKDKNNVLTLNLDDLDSDLLESNPFYATRDASKKTIVISNSATVAQISYLINHTQEKSLLAHSKYSKADRNGIFSKIKQGFGSIESTDYNLLRSGPIVQASLNITSEVLITALTTPENTLQRLGRLNRFGEDFTGEFIIAYPEHVFAEATKGLGRSSTLSFLNKNHEKDSSIQWLKLLMSNLKPNDQGVAVFTLDGIYALYHDFYHKGRCNDLLEEELVKSLHESYKNVNINIPSPVENKKLKTKPDDKSILPKLSLREAGYFSKIAQYDLSSNKIIISDDYMEGISLSRQDILMFNDNYLFIEKTVTFFELLNTSSNKKTLNKVKRIKKNKSYYQYMMVAKDEDFPIYTSLNKTDLLKLNKDDNADDSIIYVTSKKQSVGIIKLNKLYKLK